MKVIIVCIICTCILLSCSDDNEVYQQGFKDGQKSIIASQQNFTKNIKAGFELQFFISSIIVVIITLFGPEATEAIRKKFTSLWNLSIKAEIVVFTCFYTLIVLSILVWCVLIANHTLNALVPILITLAGSSIPYFKYIEALKTNDREKCKGAISKAKFLLMFSVMMVIIYQLFTGDGIMGIKVTI